MSTVIKSGDTGKTANVDSRNRLETLATSSDISVDAAQQGEAFFLTTSVLELTSASESGLFYMKNTDSIDWVLRDFNAVITQSTGAADLPLLTRFTIGPTGGTLLSGTAIIPANLNLGSSKSLAGTFAKGGEGFTVTGGVQVPQNMYLPDRNNLAVSANPIIIAPGTSFSFSLTPGTGNTSVKVVFNVTLYRDTSS